MYWRRIAVSTIPLDDAKKFESWMDHQWRIKDALLEEYVATGRFPASKSLEINTVVDGKVETITNGDFIQTAVKPAHWWEVFNIFAVLAAFGLVFNILAKVWNVARHGNMVGYKY